MAQLMPLPLTVSCFSKIQSSFNSLVPAHPGSPGQRAVKWVCVCVCVHACVRACVRACMFSSFNVAAFADTLDLFFYSSTDQISGYFQLCQMVQHTHTCLTALCPGLPG